MGALISSYEPVILVAHPGADAGMRILYETVRDIQTRCEGMGERTPPVDADRPRLLPLRRRITEPTGWMRTE